MKRTNAAILSVLALMGTAGLLAFTGLHEKAIRQVRELRVYSYGCYTTEYEYSFINGVRRYYTEYEYGCSSVCFPASATVMTEMGAKKMSDIQIGDNVQVAGGSFEPVYAFGAHKTFEPETVMVTLETKSGKSLSLSPSHWVYVEMDGIQTATKAMDVREGHVVFGENGDKEIVGKTSTSVMKGLYNPMTASGTIVVNGILASVYAGKSHPDYLHLLTTPARLASKIMSISALQRANEALGSVFGFDGVSTPSWLLMMDNVLSAVTESKGAVAMTTAACFVQEK